MHSRMTGKDKYAYYYIINNNNVYNKLFSLTTNSPKATSKFCETTQFSAKNLNLDELIILNLK